MSRNKRPFTDFDLSTRHLKADKHYVPRKARDSAEIDRRQELPPGTVVLEQQLHGIDIAASTLGLLEEQGPESILFASQTIAAAGLNTAFYLLCCNSEHQVHRRRLKLPQIATGDETVLPNLDLILPTSRQKLYQATTAAQRLRLAHSRGEQGIGVQKQLGREIGNASLTLACATSPNGLASYADGMTDFQAQLFARQRGLAVLQHAKVLTAEVGVYPSLAALADPDSGLSRYWRDAAPNDALQALERAIEEPLAA